MTESTSGFYKRLRARIETYLSSSEGPHHPWADILLLGPDLFYLLTQLARDPRVPVQQKLKLAATLTYFLSPLDFIPEMLIGPIGWLDDIALAAYALHALLNEVDPAVVRQYWLGQGDVLEVIQKIMANASRMLGTGVWKKLRRSLGSRN